jgi:hypothetical protein
MTDFICHTSAPDVYDGFGTTTEAVVGGDLRNGQPVRRVRIKAEHLDWQLSRYGSGLQRYTDPEGRITLEGFVKMGDWEIASPFLKELAERYAIA